MVNAYYALPEMQGWETAIVDHYVPGDPAAINTAGQRYDTAGSDLEKLATELSTMSTEGFWKGDAADAFTALKAKVATALGRTATMSTDMGKILQNWQQDLKTLQADDATHIRDGQRAWTDYKTAKKDCKDTQDAESRMKSATRNVSDDSTDVVSKANGYRARVTEASTYVSVNTPTPTSGSDPSLAFAKDVPTGGTMPPGAAPQPFVGPVLDESKRPMTDPRNGRLVKPAPGSPTIGPPTSWVYVN